MNERVKIIAEIGVNHNGSLDLAMRLIDKSIEVGADAVKFQSFSSGNLTTAKAKKAKYQLTDPNDTESQKDMLSKLELNQDHHYRLKEYCDNQKIEFISTPFDICKLSFLANEIKVNCLKIASGDLINSPLLYKAAETRLPVILSTGMGTIEEICEAIAIFAYQEENPNVSPKSRKDLRKYNDPKGWSTNLKNRISLLHCVSLYPTPPHLANLRSIPYLKEYTNLQVGFSDHTQGSLVTVAAVAMGATMIEKHITLSHHLPGPDHISSLEVTEFRNMVQSIRTIEAALGEFQKKPNAQELEVASIVRGSLVAAKYIPKNSNFTLENLTVKRSGHGLSPHFYWDAIHQCKAASDFKEDDQINIQLMENV